MQDALLLITKNRLDLVWPPMILLEVYEHTCHGTISWRAGVAYTVISDPNC